MLKIFHFSVIGKVPGNFLPQKSKTVHIDREIFFWDFFSQKILAILFQKYLKLGKKISPKK